MLLDPTFQDKEQLYGRRIFSPLCAVFDWRGMAKFIAGVRYLEMSFKSWLDLILRLGVY